MASRAGNVSPILRRTLLFIVLTGMSEFANAGSPAWGAEPAIRNLPVRGLEVGGTTMLVVEGDDLGSSPRLLLSFPAKQKLKPGSTDKQATFEVAVDNTVAPGYYHVRVVTDGGVSLPMTIAVDRFRQGPLPTPTDPLPTLPVALHGVVNGSSTVETRFQGKAGQKVLLEVEAQRLGSKLRPILHLYSPRKLQLGWSWPTPGLGGDTRLEVTLPEDGAYSVALHDTEYAAPGPGFFRLKLGSWSFVDQVFPPVIGKDQRTVELIGSSPGVRVDLPASRTGPVVPLAWPREGNWSGARPYAVVNSRNEVIEGPATGKPQELPVGSVGVSGKLLSPSEEDRYRIPAKPGSKVRLELFAERLGSPLDATLVVRNDTGAELARAEDSPGSLDPVLDYTVPDKVTSLVVGISSQGGEGPRGIYRLTVDPLPLPAGKVDFRLSTSSRRISLPVGGRSVIPVLVERHGYQGSITLSAEGVPAGLKVEGNTIPAGADGTLVTIHRTGGSTEAVFTRWKGRGEDGQERTVLQKGDTLERIQPWEATELPLVPTSNKAAEFQVDWRDPRADVGLVPAGKKALPVKVTRPAGNTLVRLTLLTSQLPPLVNNVPDLNQTLRAERPVELPAKVADADFTVLVPPQLPGDGYDAAIQAELLSPDRRTVLATSYTPVRRLPVRLPLSVKLDGPGRIEAKRDVKTGITAEIKGKVERREGATGDVTVNLMGLPPGGRVDAVTVKAGAIDFVVKLTLPPTVAGGDLAGLKLSGTVAPDPKQPGVRVRSRDVELVVVVPAAK